jgi:hypothetical protein
MEPASKNSQNLVQEASPWDQLRNGDFWKLMSEHWPNAKKGAADSQLIVHSIMSSWHLVASIALPSPTMNRLP